LRHVKIGILNSIGPQEKVVTLALLILQQIQSQAIALRKKGTLNSIGTQETVVTLALLTLQQIK
jgi:hypothetical protein